MINTKKINLIVIMGGPSAEHDVSIRSGIEVLKNLDENKYSKKVLVISKNKKFYFCENPTDSLYESDFFNPNESKFFGNAIEPYDSKNIWNNIDLAFLALHGEFGEDGYIQGYLNTIGIPHTGSDLYASSVAMNKITAKQIFEANNISTPPYSVIYTKEKNYNLDELAQKHGFPCYIKSPQSGSSKLMYRTNNIDQLDKYLKELESHTPTILVESNIVGEEYSCPVIEDANGSIKALPPILIRLKNSEYFDYDAKYTVGATEEITPAPCSKDLTRKIQNIAQKAHKALGCSGISRTDMIYTNGTLYVLEINTLPGLTTESLAPKSFKASGGTYSELLDTIIDTAISKTGVNN